MYKRRANKINKTKQKKNGISFVRNKKIYTKYTIKKWMKNVNCFGLC